MSEPINDIWKDPNVKAALKEGRPAEDIAVLRCPKCIRWGYYNQGSHFWCRFCKQGWYCCNDCEVPPSDKQYLWLDGFVSLADTVTVPTDGYDNETLPGHISSPARSGEVPPPVSGEQAEKMPTAEGGRQTAPKL